MRQARIWHLARTRRPTKALHGLVHIRVDQLPAALRCNESPDGEFHEHAVIVGWPEDKEEQLVLQVALSKASPDLVAPPPSPALARR